MWIFYHWHILTLVANFCHQSLDSITVFTLLSNDVTGILDLSLEGSNAIVIEISDGRLVVLGVSFAQTGVLVGLEVVMAVTNVVGL